MSVQVEPEYASGSIAPLCLLITGIRAVRSSLNVSQTLILKNQPILIFGSFQNRLDLYTRYRKKLGAIHHLLR